MFKNPTSHVQQGMTLIELMVAMVLGLVTTLIVAQVMVNAEGQRRTTTSGTDAQINGASGLYLLSRDLQAAGYGLIGKSTMRGCPIRWANGNTAITDFRLLPVSMTVDAAGNAVIRILSSGSTDFAVPVAVQEGLQPATLAATGFKVRSTLGMAPGHLMVVAPPAWDPADNTTWCTLFPAGTISTATTLPVNGISATPVSDEQKAEFGGFGPEVFPAAGYPLESTVVNLGTVPDLREYRVANNTLQMRRLLTTGAWGDWQTMAPGVVRMVALYGVDDTVPADGRVDRYTTTSPANADGWSRVLTMRVAVVARSAQFERPITESVSNTVTRVTTAAPRWLLGHRSIPVEGATPCSVTKNEDEEDVESDQACMSLSVGATPADGTPTPPDQDWRNYRYKIFDTVVPLRNQVWSPL